MIEMKNLRQIYETLQQENQELSEDYNSVMIEMEAMGQKYDTLQQENQLLRENHSRKKCLQVQEKLKVLGSRLDSFIRTDTKTEREVGLNDPP